jgi:hypothetical protein
MCFMAQVMGATPLYVASENGHVEVVRELLEEGAGVDVNQGRVSWLCCCEQNCDGAMLS